MPRATIFFIFITFPPSVCTVDTFVCLMQTFASFYHAHEILQALTENLFIMSFYNKQLSKLVDFSRTA
jgi:hypothetical protein